MSTKSRLFVKDWHEHQHYRNRRPPWIKLHRALLDDMTFASLPLYAKAVLPMLWLLASESDDGSIPADPAAIAFRLRIDTATAESALSDLADVGFLHRASSVLARRKHVASAETEREGETETDLEINQKPLPESKYLGLDIYTREGGCND